MSPGAGSAATHASGIASENKASGAMLNSDWLPSESRIATPAIVRRRPSQRLGGRIDE
jgi:hypothetical protein